MLAYFITPELLLMFGWSDIPDIFHHYLVRLSQGSAGYVGVLLFLVLFSRTLVWTCLPLARLSSFYKRSSVQVDLAAGKSVSMIEL